MFHSLGVAVIEGTEWEVEERQTESKLNGQAVDQHLGVVD